MKRKKIKNDARLFRYTYTIFYMIFRFYSKSILSVADIFSIIIFFFSWYIAFIP